MGFRAVGTNDGTYAGIGGQNQETLKAEDPTKKYVNIYIRGGTGRTVSVEVKYLMEALQVEGFIETFTLPEVEDPLTLVERVAKALMNNYERCAYADAEFRAQVDYMDYIAEATELMRDL